VPCGDCRGGAAVIGRPCRAVIGQHLPPGSGGGCPSVSAGVGVGGLGVGASGRGGPGEGAWLGLGELPSGPLLEAVVGTACAAEVAVAGPAALVVGDGVVLVGAAGGLAAYRAAAGLVPGRDVFAQPGRRPVGGAGPPVRAPAGADAGCLGDVGVRAGGSPRGRFERCGEYRAQRATGSRVGRQSSGGLAVPRDRVLRAGTGCGPGPGHGS